MGKTMVEAFVTGENGIRRFDFLVDTGSSYIGLPIADIKELGLNKLPGASHKIRTALGVLESDTYAASVRIGEDRAPALVIVSPTPFIGFRMLENLRMKVNPVTQKLEKAPEDEIMPPYAL